MDGLVVIVTMVFVVHGEAGFFGDDFFTVIAVVDFHMFSGLYLMCLFSDLRYIICFMMWMISSSS